MTVEVRSEAMVPGNTNASSFLELYEWERPAPAIPVERFIDGLKDLVRAHPIENELASALKYGTASRDAMRRWIKEYYTYIRMDAQATAAMIARCRRRGLFLTLSPLVNRKTGYHQVTKPAVRLFIRFAEAFGLSKSDLEAQFACSETLQATYTRLQFQYSSFEEAFVVNALAAEGPLLDTVRDERPWLCQRGISEYMKRAYSLDDDTVAYWRAYEDFRGFVTEPVWEIVREIAVDASQQDVLRTTLQHWLLIYQNMRRAWGEIITEKYEAPEFAWPPEGLKINTGSDQSYEDMEEELGEFCLRLPRPKETAFGLVLSGKASKRAMQEVIKDLFHLDATRNIAGQFSQIPDGRAVHAMAQAFACESGGYLTRCHMEIWADFCEQAFGISRQELCTWRPPTETIASRYVTKWFLVHAAPEEAIAAFHLGPPTRVKKKMEKRALGLGQGGVAGEGLLEEHVKNPLTAALEKYGVNPDLADYFFRLHREIEPFEQDEGWEYVPSVIETPQQRQRFKRAYISKILSEARKDEGLIRRMKSL